MLSYLKSKLGGEEENENIVEQQFDSVLELGQESKEEELFDKDTFDELVEWKSNTFDIIKDIRDPEKPETLQDLNVVSEDLIGVEYSADKHFLLDIQFVPTVPHCSLATLIGLCIRAKLDRELPQGQFKLHLSIKEGTHSTADEITKQINDKERVAAALENPNLKQTVEDCINHSPI